MGATDHDTAHDHGAAGPTGLSAERAPLAPEISRHADERATILARFMSQRGLKSTRQRSLIVDAFFEQDGHVSVEELLALVRRRDSRVSTATVYRTMKLLVECGLAHARHFGDGQTRYESAAGRHHHDHLICTRCDRIVEFENDRIEQLQQAVARKHSFKVTDHKMELYGLCRPCQLATRGKG